MLAQKQSIRLASAAVAKCRLYLQPPQLFVARYVTASSPGCSSRTQDRNPHNKWAKKGPASYLAAACVAAAFLSTTETVSSCESEDPIMYYRMLGNTGLKVSVLSYGFWATFGSKSSLKKDGEGR